MLSKVKDHELRQAFTRWDRATAYGCRLRGITYDPRLERSRWFAWQAVMESALQ